MHPNPSMASTSNDTITCRPKHPENVPSLASFPRASISQHSCAQAGRFQPAAQPGTVSVPMIPSTNGKSCPRAYSCPPAQLFQVLKTCLQNPESPGWWGQEWLWSQNQHTHPEWNSFRRNSFTWGLCVWNQRSGCANCVLAHSLKIQSIAQRKIA